MERKPLQNVGLRVQGEGEGEEEEEQEEEEELYRSEGSQDETDEEAEKERFVRKVNAKKRVGGSEDEGLSEDGEDEDGDEAEAEPLVRVSQTKPVGEEQRVKGQRGKVFNVAESRSGSGSSGKGSSDEESGRRIGLILANERVVPGAGNVMKGGRKRGKPSRAGIGQTENTATNSKSEFQKMTREEVKEEEVTPMKRKKEGGTRKRELKSASTTGKRAHSGSVKEILQAQKPEGEEITSAQIPQSSKERIETARKKSRKQKPLAQDETQKRNHEGTEEPQGKGPQKIEKGTAKKTNKKHGGAEDDKIQLEHIEVGSETKANNQKQQKLQLSADNELKIQQSLSSQKQKTPTFWSPGDETALIYRLNHHLKLVGNVLPKRADDLWNKISAELPNNRTKDQLYDKARRMRRRYKLIVEKTKAAGSVSFHYKNEHEENLFRIWEQIWGTEVRYNREDNGEEEAVEEEHQPSEPVVRTNASNPRKEVKEEKELISAKEKQGEERGEDGNDTLQECATAMELDQTHLPMSTLASLANVSRSNGPLECSADFMQPHKNSSVLNNMQDHMLPQSDAENTPLMTEFFNLMRTSNQALLEEVKSQCNHILGEVQAKTKAIVENRMKSAAKGFQFYNGMNYFMPPPFPMPSLAVEDAMDIKLFSGNKDVQDKLTQQWHEQHLQELKIFSQRLHLMQEQCRIQQEDLNMH